MTLQSIINERLETQDIKEVAKKLGYSTSDKVSIRIKSIIKSPHLSLDESQYDFRYSTEQLITKLCAELEIPTLLSKTIITNIQRELQIEAQRFKPYIFIETGFKRTDESIVRLLAMASKRYLSLEGDFTTLPLNEQLTSVRDVIINHAKNHSNLAVWGEIQQYAYFFEGDLIFTFSPAGELLDAMSEYNFPHFFCALP